MADYAARATDEALKALERRIRSVYTQAQKDIEAKTKDFWERHKVKDAKYRQQVKDGKISVEDYQAWLRGQVFQGEQWKTKLQQVQSVLAQANKNALNIINGGRIEVFATNSNWTAYNLEKTAGVNFGFGIYDADAVTRLLRDDPDLLPAKKLNVTKDKLWNKGNINRQISQGIIQGESLDKIAKRLRTVTDMNKNSSLTNARTMMTGAQNAGRQETYQRAKKKGIKLKKEWLATLDGHTRATHAALDGQQVDTDEPFRIGGFSIMYPGDRNAPPAMVYGCRCTTVAALEDYPDDEFTQRYDNVTGKPIKDLTFDEWKKFKLEEPEIEVDTIQSAIGKAKSVEELNGILNGQGWFKKWNGIESHGSLDRCDLDAAKSVCSSYARMFELYPQLIGKLDAPSGTGQMNSATYAWCYIRRNGKVEFNVVHWYNNFDKLKRQYERDVSSNWHPKGTTAESVIIHELGHAVDGLLAREGILGGMNAAGEYRYASSLMRAPTMKACGLKVSDVSDTVSRYASTNPQEWFAECFAEYLTSANPRPVAAEFGKRLEKLLEELSNGQ